MLISRISELLSQVLSVQYNAMWDDEKPIVVLCVRNDEVGYELKIELCDFENFTDETICDILLRAEYAIFPGKGGH